MNVDLDKLERLAKEAIPGPWVHENATRIYAAEKKELCAMSWEHPKQARKNAAYITAVCNAAPELIKRVRELERQRDWLAERIHRKGTVTYGKYPPTTEGWIKAAEQATKGDEE